MKYKNFLFLLIIILFVSGCSSSKGSNSPTKGPTPTLGASPTVINAPTNLPTQSPSPTAAPSPTEELTKDGTNPDSEIESTALQILNQMSLEEKVGQMFFVR